MNIGIFQSESEREGLKIKINNRGRQLVGGEAERMQGVVVAGKCLGGRTAAHRGGLRG